MRRFYLLWIYAVLLAAAGAGSIQSFLEEKHLLADERSKAVSLASSLEDSVEENIQSGELNRLARTARRLQGQPRFVGLAVCAYSRASGAFLPARSRGFPASWAWQSLCESAPGRALVPETADARINGAAETSAETSWLPAASEAEPRRLHYHFLRLDMADETGALTGPAMDASYVLVIARDLSYLRGIWLESFLRGFFVTLVLGAALLFLVTSQMRRWIQKHITLFHKNLRSVIAGRKPMTLGKAGEAEGLRELRPLHEDINQLARILSTRTINPAQSSGPVPPSLTQTIAQKNLVVIANREPYIHQRTPGSGEGSIEVIRPASGLVTALEPILRQCGGLWLAHGSGTADFDVTNSQGEVPVPPEKPTYTLKRVALTKEQEEGYYYGFANEGLWPLCHLAHTRPVFRLNDWRHYVEVNQLFADRVPVETLNAETLFLVQDYHFALLPDMLKKRATPFRKTRIGIFWHIPWPNPEAFGICPWNQELLRGMLGSDVIGFHTQYHCNNFLESCNRYLEARIDYEHFSVTMDNHETRVRAFPIGIDTAPVKVLSQKEREALKARYGIHAEWIAVGVDRIDYTKGIVERVEAVERFLEKNPEYVGRFSLVQMGSPSRTHIPAYRNLYEELTRAVDRVNARFGNPENYRPVIFIPTHHEWKDIQFFYQLGDICMVTSLHDGMNLVAKEYVWCQKPERGSLILSKFTGASRELTESIIVNPYSVEEMADAVHTALTLTPEEKASRMMAMREKVHARNAYRWASELIEALITRPAGPEHGSAPLAAPGPRDTSLSDDARHA